MRRIEHEQVEVPMGAAEQAGRSAKEIRYVAEYFRRRQRLDDIGISRHQGPRFDVIGSQRGRERADDIGKASRFDDRIDFGSDGKNAKWRHASSLSIIGWVIRVMPCAVVRNRLASNSGSSPTTRPSGMWTPRSITTFFNRAPRPTLT